MIRPSDGTVQQDRQWRGVIRVFAIIVAIFGLVLFANEIVEQVRCTTSLCKLHLSTMLWGVSLLSLGLLILQRGDVSASLKDAAATGTIVRGWFTRGGRATDPEGTKVTTVVRTPVDQPPGDP